MENARLYAVAVAFITVAGTAAFIRQQLNTTDLLADLRSSKDSHKAAEEQLAGFRQSVAAKHAELASLTEKLLGRSALLAAKAEIERLKASIEQIKVGRAELENAFREVIRGVRNQTIGTELPPQKLANGTVLTHAKIKRVEDNYLVLVHELGVSKLTAKELPSELPSELVEKMRVGDPLFSEPATGEKTTAANPPAPAQNSAPRKTAASGNLKQRLINEVREEINKTKLQISQYEDSAKGWRNMALAYRSKVSPGKISSWGLEATRADGEADKAEGVIKQLNYHLIELQRKMDDVTIDR